MAGCKPASLSYFTLYFTLARVILLGWETDFKSLSSLPKIPLQPYLPQGLCILSCL